jgi:DNA-binding GntR family transcriptional regulator
MEKMLKKAQEPLSRPEPLRQDSTGEDGMEQAHWAPAKMPSRATVQDHVHEQLRNALMGGRFEPGQTLTMASLASMFGTSQMPVREALRRLVAENALRILSSGSAVVPDISLARLDDICGVRVLLERRAVEAATNLITDKELAALRELAAAHRQIGRTDGAYAMLDMNRQFHFRLYGNAGSPALMQLIETLWLSFGPFMRPLCEQIEAELHAGGDVYVGCHDEILDALQRRDAQAAGDGIANDIRSTQRLLRRISERGSEYPLGAASSF